MTWGGHIQSCVYVLPPLFHEKEKRRGGQKFLKQDIIMRSPFHSPGGAISGGQDTPPPFLDAFAHGTNDLQAPIYQHHLMNTDISQKKKIYK